MAVAVVAALAVLSVAGCTASSVKTTTTTTTSAGSAFGTAPSMTVVTLSPLDRVVAAWNSEVQNPLNRVFQVTLSQFVDQYVCVGFAANLPGRGMITLATPTAWVEFVQASSNPTGSAWSVTAQGTDLSLVPESAKQWNATLHADGTITLK